MLESAARAGTLLTVSGKHTVEVVGETWWPEIHHTLIINSQSLIYQPLPTPRNLGGRKFQVG